MIKRTVVLGDKQTLSLEFPDAKEGDTYTVDVQTQHPDGTIVSNMIAYTFVSPVTKKVIKAEKNATNPS